jgi:hypothetical protein
MNLSGGHKPLAPEHTGIVLHGPLEVGTPGDGYGFFLSDNPSARIPQHGDDGVGMRAVLVICLGARYTTFVLSNHHRPEGDMLGGVIHQRLTAQ